MQILILGGTGVLSTDFTKRVLDAGCQTTIVNRGRRKGFIDPRARLICADLRTENIQSLREKITDRFYDVVVDFLSYEPKHLERSLEIVAGYFIQYIFISTATVYKKSFADEVITENTPIGNEKWRYAYQKSLCERLLTECSEINYTIIRPYVTYGDSRIPFPIIPNGYHYTLIKRIQEGKPVPLYQDGKATCTLTHTKDFAEVLYRLLLNPKAYGQAFHITSPYRQSWKEVYLALCGILKCKPNSFSVDADQVKKFLPEYFDILQGDKGTSMLFDNSKVMRAIGDFQFTIPFEKGLESSVRFFESNQAMQLIDNRWDGRIDYLFRHCVRSNKALRCLPQPQEEDNSSKKGWYYAMCFGPINKMYSSYWKYKNKHH